LDEVGDYFGEFRRGERVVVGGPQVDVGYLLVVRAFHAADELAELLNGESFLFGGVLPGVYFLVATYRVRWVTHFYFYKR
jgi:hypothetical protein